MIPITTHRKSGREETRFSHWSQLGAQYTKAASPPKKNRTVKAPLRFCTRPDKVMVVPQASPMAAIQVCGEMYIKQI